MNHMLVLLEYPGNSQCGKQAGGLYHSYAIHWHCAQSLRYTLALWLFCFPTFHVSALYISIYV